MNWLAGDEDLQRSAEENFSNKAEVWLHPLPTSTPYTQDPPTKSVLLCPTFSVTHTCHTAGKKKKLHPQPDETRERDRQHQIKLPIKLLDRISLCLVSP